jgi:hypothetical protein
VPVATRKSIRSWEKTALFGHDIMGPRPDDRLSQDAIRLEFLYSLLSGSLQLFYAAGNVEIYD